MTPYRHQLPQLNGQLFLLDGGLETALIYLQGVELPYFAAFDLLSIEAGRQRLRDYFRPFVDLAKREHCGLILESPTWRANRDWAQKLGYSADDLAHSNRQAIELMEEIRQAHQTPALPMVISGCIGPRGDGYVPGKRMTPAQARDYHSEQINVFADTAADFVCALTMNYVDEAIGIVHAARDAGMPVVISFTTETDGRLPDGTSLQRAIEAVEAATDQGPAYYMINCAHPEHFAPALQAGAPWVQRVRGLRANASRKSHQELDQSTELDRGDPGELGAFYRQLRHSFPQFTVLGGCCGTDIEHLDCIASCCRAS